MIRTLRRGLAAAAGIVVIALMSACGGGGGASSSTAATAAAGDGSTVRIGSSVPQLSDPGLSLQAEVTEEQASKYGMSVDTVDANVAPPKQIADVKSLLQKGVEGLIVWPIVSQAIAPAIAEADRRDVPVVVRQTFTGGPYATNIATDDVGAGEAMAAYLGEQLGSGAKVAAVLGPQQVATFRDFAAGFKRGARAAGLDLVDAVVNQSASSSKAQALAAQLKTRYGSELDGLFVSLSTWAMPIAAVAGGDFSPEIVTVGLDESGIEGVESGQIAAMDYVSVVALGRAEAWAMNQALEGKRMPKDLWIRYQLIDDSTVSGLPSTEEQRQTESSFAVADEGGRSYLEVSGTAGE